MGYIGNILIETPTKDINDWFNQTNDFNQLIEGLPTLIIGINLAKKYIPNFNIIYHQYGNIFWCFKKFENKDDYNYWLNYFLKYTLNNPISKIIYNNIDIPSLTINNVKSLLNFLNNNIKKIILNYNNTQILCYIPSMNKVVGISLNTLEYIGIEKTKIINLIYKRINKNTIVIRDYDKINLILKSIGNFNYEKALVLYTIINSL